MIKDQDTRPSRGTCLRVTVLVFMFIFLVAGKCFFELVDIFVAAEELPQSFAFPIVVVSASVSAFILSRKIFLCLRTGRIPYPLRLRLVHNFRQSVKFAHWTYGSIVSSILLLIILLAWMRSYWRADLMSISFPETKCFCLVSCVGIIRVDYLNCPVQDFQFKIDSHDSEIFNQNYDIWTLVFASIIGKNVVIYEDDVFYSFRTRNRSFTLNGIKYKMMSLDLPYWLFASVLAILPCWVMVGGFVRYRRVQAILCRNCGYNLTGNVSGVCPECGEKI